MKVTKRDIADISLVWIAFNFIPYLFNYAIYALFFLFFLFKPSPSASVFTSPAENKWFQLSSSLGQFCIMAAFFWFLLFKRHIILNRLFPDSETKTLDLHDDSAVKLTDYSFWITIFCLFTAIQSGIKFISGTLRCIDTDKSIGEFFQNMWKYNSMHILAVVLAVVVIWKANSFSSMLCRKNKRNARISNV